MPQEKHYNLSGLWDFVVQRKQSPKHRPEGLSARRLSTWSQPLVIWRKYHKGGYTKRGLRGNQNVPALWYFSDKVPPRKTSYYIINTSSSKPWAWYRAFKGRCVGNWGIEGSMVWQWTSIGDSRRLNGSAWSLTPIHNKGPLRQALAVIHSLFHKTGHSHSKGGNDKKWLCNKGMHHSRDMAWSVASTRTTEGHPLLHLSVFLLLSLVLQFPFISKKGSRSLL